ncbi:MAG: hypothetical protein SWH68_16440, partial [Thermodesulfobacteriota bacterium]|nr:hypothetical protein [Thermodesulfobacteriota bacterium]
RRGLMHLHKMTGEFLPAPEKASLRGKPKAPKYQIDAGRPFFCILFFGRAKKSMNEKLVV